MLLFSGLPSNQVPSPDGCQEPPPDPETITDAKGWLRGHMPKNRKYSEPRDQPALTAVFDLDQARSRSDSFDKCYREIERLIAVLRPPEQPTL